MDKVRVEAVEEGIGPEERVVVIMTADGRKEELFVDSRSIREGNVIEVAIIQKETDKSLIELPRETMTGRWRVWVSNSLFTTKNAYA